MGDAPGTIETDLVIIGGGGAGLPAALTAHEQGIRALVLEKRARVGGNAMLAEGFFAADSPAQSRLLIHADRDLLYKRALDYAHYKVDPKILRVFINRSGDTVRWIEAMGHRFERVVPFYPNQVPLVWHIVEGHGATLVRLFDQECRKKEIPILTRTEVRKVSVDGQGRINGVLAAGEDGELAIKARVVLIATGGYAGNSELLKRYCPQHEQIVEQSGVPGMTGDGLNMAMALGAATEGLGHLMMVGPAPYPKNWAVEAVAGEPYAVWVNADGERFIDETVTFNVFEAINAILRQKNGQCFALIDSRIKEQIIQQGVVRGCGEIFVRRGEKMEDLERDLDKQIERGGAFRASSLEEIAAWIGAPGPSLAHTVSEYNQCCRRRYDEWFVKDRRYLRALEAPPYYAIRCGGAVLGTSGGIRINHRMEVLGSDAAPIPGLYAAGADTGGWESDTYCALLPGSAFGFALNSGRIAAENAAQFIRQQ